LRKNEISRDIVRHELKPYVCLSRALTGPLPVDPRKRHAFSSLLAYSDQSGPGKSNLQDNIIRLEDVHLTLGEGASRVHVLDGASLTVLRGESVAVLGPSGSGKSTLLMVMAGLERADRGTVVVGDSALTGMDEDGLASFRGRNIGIVFQSFHLIANMTALENVAVPLELAGDKDAFDKAEHELRAVGLGGRESHYPGQLSGGEQQRVAIARALAPNPLILVADEPTGNLDGETGTQVADLLFAKQKERGTTLVLVTHDTRLAERCGRIVRVRNGSVERDGEPKAEPKTARSAEKVRS
jgi:putative ABC transport system ATP-binding protein